MESRKLEDILHDIERFAVDGELTREEVKTFGYKPFIARNPRQILGDGEYEKLTRKQDRLFAWLYDAAKRNGLFDMCKDFEIALLMFRNGRTPKTQFMRIDAAVLFHDGHADNYSMFFPASALSEPPDVYYREYAKPMASRLAHIMDASVDFTMVDSVVITVCQYHRESSTP